jgi:hypothetical protein
MMNRCESRFVGDRGSSFLSVAGFGRGVDGVRAAVMKGVCPRGLAGRWSLSGGRRRDVEGRVRAGGSSCPCGGSWSRGSCEGT